MLFAHNIGFCRRPFRLSAGVVRAGQNPDSV